MSKNCTATFNINSADGTSTSFELEVPEVGGLSLEEAIEQLVNNKELLQTITEAINRSGFPLTKIDTKALQESIPVGNYTLSQVAGKFDTPNISYLVNKLKEVGVDINQQNILLTNAAFSQKWNKSLGIYEKDGKSIVLLRPDKKAIEPYLKQLYINEAVKGENPEFKETLQGYIDSTLAELSKTASDTSRLKNIISTIQESKDPMREFIRYYYTSSNFNHILYKSGLIGQFKQLFNDFLNPSAMLAQSYSDPMVSEFAAKITNNKMSMDVMKEFMDQYGMSSPLAAIQEINNRIEGNKFFDIKFIGENAILFQRSKLKPLFEVDAINSEYFGEMVKPIMNVNGFNILEYNDKYYVTDRVITNVEGLKGEGFKTLNMARGVINSYLDRERMSLTKIRNKVKQGLVFSSLQKMSVGDRVSALDIEITNAELNQTDKKLATLTYNQFKKELVSSALWKKVSANLLTEGLSMDAILNTPEKIETFILLRAQNRNPELYSTIYTNKSPRIDSPEKVEFETNLSRDALIKIRDAKDKVYEVVEHNGNKFLMEEVVANTDIPLFSKQPRSLKSDMVNIAEHLSRNYGVKVNILTTSDIESTFKDIIPNASRINAFIYNNEVYVNVDKASTADPLHEFAHLILGSVKKNNSKLYYSLVDQVEALTDYNDRLNAYLQNNDKRARTDLNEEIFVTIFGEYFSKKMNPWFNGRDVDLVELGSKFKDGTQKVFQTGNDIQGEALGVLLNMSIDEIVSEFGSTLFNGEFSDAANFDLDGSYKSRTITNLISKLLEGGQLVENCE